MGGQDLEPDNRGGALKWVHQVTCRGGDNECGGTFRLLPLGALPRLA